MQTNLLEYPRVLRCALVGLTHAIPEKAISDPPTRATSKSHIPYEVAKLGEFLSVVTIEQKLRGWVDNNPSVKFPLAEHYCGTNTRIFPHDRLC